MEPVVLFGDEMVPLVLKAYKRSWILLSWHQSWPCLGVARCAQLHGLLKLSSQRGNWIVQQDTAN